MKPDSFGHPRLGPGSPFLQDTLPAAPVVLRFAPATARLRVLRRYLWRIIAVVVLALGLTYGASSLVTPLYEATATIDIDVRMPVSVLGSDARQFSAFDTDQFMATQIKLIQSDAVLRPVAQRYRLQELENQRLETSKLPEAVRKLSPVTLKKLRINRPPNTLLIQVGYRSPDTELSAKVANDIAAAYVQHTYDLRYRSAENIAAFMEKQLEQLKTKMERSSDRLIAFDRDLSIVDPVQKTAILSSRLVQINSEYATAEGDRVRKEAALNSIKNGSIDAAQVSTQGDALRATVERLNEAQRRFAPVKSQFGKNFPEYKKAAAEVAELQAQVDITRTSVAQRVEAEFRQAADREGMLAASVTGLKREFDALNARSFEYQTLRRDADADRKLYDELVQKIKEAGINAGFQNSSIRVADIARPTLKPISPNIPLNLFLALCFSTFAAVVLAMFLDERDLPVRDAQQLGSALQISVLGSLPLVKNAPRALIAPGASKMLTGTRAPLTRIMFEEAVQSLCSTVLLCSAQKVTRSLVVTSPLPGQGKTVTACHLAVANARKQRRTLLIDCDLRSPAVHLHCGIEQTGGLDEVLRGAATWHEMLCRPAEVPGLDILPAGHTTSAGPNLVGRELPRILAEAREEYDLVVIDSPPLAFAESLEIAAATDGVLLLAVAGETSSRLMRHCVATLRQVGVQNIGLVLNKITTANTDYDYYGKYARYYKRYASGRPA